jgi:NADPH-dependent ferric siderophore reductase
VPTRPVPVADLAERRFGVTGTIVAADLLSPGLLMLRFTCPHPRWKRWRIGQAIEFRVGRRMFRHYSVMDYHATDDESTGLMSVLFYLRSEGPGSLWISERTVGGTVTVIGPGSNLPELTGSRRLLLGDTTSLGAFAGMIAAAGEGTVFTGAVEVDACDIDAAERLAPGLTAVAAGDQPGAALLGWLVGAITEQPDLADIACLTGHAQTIGSLRDLLRAGSGLEARAIVTKPYWATGKAGL